MSGILNKIGSFVFEGVLTVVTKALGLTTTVVVKVGSVVFGVVAKVVGAVEWVVDKVMTVTGSTGRFICKAVYLASCTGKMFLAFFPYEVRDSKFLTMVTNPAKGCKASVVVVAGTAYILY